LGWTNPVSSKGGGGDSGRKPLRLAFKRGRVGEVVDRGVSNKGPPSRELRKGQWWATKPFHLVFERGRGHVKMAEVV